MILKNCITKLFFDIKLIKRYSTGASITALYDFHVKNGGKMVNFGGFMLPVQYNDQGITASHQHTRKHASLFDVSHMLQSEVSGASCTQYMESICTADLEGLAKGKGTLSVFTNEHAGILDDLIVTKLDEDHLYIVSNAARKEHDQQHMLNALARYKLSIPWNNIKIRFFDPSERSLLALQGPESAACLQKLTTVNLSSLYFMNSASATVAGVESCRITRCGYTGEDGFEISIPAIKSTDVAEALLMDERVKLAGLGARDSLRLEAGLCLYGSDITLETTPAEAGLMWLISKRRRNLGNFPGAPVIKTQTKVGPLKKRIGLVSMEGPPARHDTPIFCESDDDHPIGAVTSGCPSPSLGKNIAMGYVPLQFSTPGTELVYKIRDKFYEAVVTKMPFIETHYYVKGK